MPETYMDKFGLALDGNATHAYFEPVKLGVQLDRNGMQAFSSRGMEQEFAETLYFSQTTYA
jgi:hypothetical protein